MIRPLKYRHLLWLLSFFLQFYWRILLWQQLANEEVSLSLKLWNIQLLSHQWPGPKLFNITFSLLFSYFFFVSSLTRVQSLSIFTSGQCNLFLFKWNCLIPFFPKYPGWYLSKRILWWCWPPAFPLPAGCFLCFPTLPCPWDTWPLNFRHFFKLAV